MIPEYKILVKYPSRERATQFMTTITGYINKSSQKNIKYFITLDKNRENQHRDPQTERYINFINQLKNEGIEIDYNVDESQSKIHAVNRDMEMTGDWDILVLASDDMICKVENWDEILRKEMYENFPDTDGVLWHWDGADGKGCSTRPTLVDGKVQGGLNTMCIMGRKYYEDRGHIYWHEYKNLWCDNEFTLVSLILKKCFYSPLVMWAHEHWANGVQFRHTNDHLMKETQSSFQYDQKIFSKREAINFGL